MEDIKPGKLEPYEKNVLKENIAQTWNEMARQEHRDDRWEVINGELVKVH